ncbi:hypothetical protein A3Q56_07350 [Intoshia linei]|uniref:60S ribosomal protein L31 n=1 Tax=Intoshia linei TaxID=1819745 RepID=A0A177ASG7_9BILA|nr:hypothetical protein A3Q56_07350 [Intoshia linei]
MEEYKTHMVIPNVPRRIRVRLSRQRNEDDHSNPKVFTLVTALNVASFKGLQTKEVESTN